MIEQAVRIVNDCAVISLGLLIAITGVGISFVVLFIVITSAVGITLIIMFVVGILTLLPKSQIEVNDDGTITLPEWLAEEKRLI